MKISKRESGRGSKRERMGEEVYYTSMTTENYTDEGKV